MQSSNHGKPAKTERSTQSVDVPPVIFDNTSVLYVEQPEPDTQKCNEANINTRSSGAIEMSNLLYCIVEPPRQTTSVTTLVVLQLSTPDANRCIINRLKSSPNIFSWTRSLQYSLFSQWWCSMCQPAHYLATTACWHNNCIDSIRVSSVRSNVIIMIVGNDSILSRIILKVSCNVTLSFCGCFKGVPTNGVNCGDVGER